jgi:two-component system, LytTR family, response regulator
MIKVAIIDDEQHCIDTLKHHLQPIDDVEIAFTTTESINAISLLETHKPNLVFLDVDMPHLNGIDLILSLKNITFSIVFATAHHQYAIQAFKLNALDYILKPVAFDDVNNCINKLKKNDTNIIPEQLQHLKNSIDGKIQETLALSTHGGLIFIDIKNIVYIEGEGSYTKIIMNDNSKHLVSKNLSSFSDILIENHTLFRPHKSFIINLKYIKQYVRGEGGEIIMQDGTSITLSRQKKQDFLAKFHKI